MSPIASIRRAALTLAALALSVGPALAGGVRIVDPGGALNFPDIQSAIDAAVDGDVLLVGAGTYPGFTLDGKNLSIFAAPPGASVSVSGTVTVKNVSGRGVLAGLHVAPAGSALSVASCSGDVRLQDCTFIGHSGPCSFGSCSPGFPAANIVQSGKVVAVGCTFQAGNTGNGGLYGLHATGAYGLRLQASTVAMYDSSVFGGSGPDAHHDDMGPGGPGTVVASSWLFLSKCSSMGGQGGDDLSDIPIFGGQCGGSGIAIDATSSVHLLDVSAVGGPGGLPSFGCGSGPAILNQGGRLDAIAGTARTTGLAAITADRSPWNVSVSGVVGDQVFLNRSLEPVFQYEPTLSGVCTSVLPPFTTVAPAGILPASGTLAVSLRQRLLPEDVLARVNYLQGWVIEAGGATVLGSPMHVVSLNWSSLPDCNGNGIQDYAEVILGVTPDVDHDLVPDGCP